MNGTGIPNELTLAATQAIAAQSEGLTIPFGQTTPVTAEPFLFGGFSDTEIIRLTCNAGRFALRSWPNADASHEKVKFWRTMQGPWADRPYFPTMVTWRSDRMQGDRSEPLWLMPHNGKLWTLAQWVDGSPVDPARIDQALIQHLAHTLGQLHATTLKLSQRPGSILQFVIAESASLLDRKRALDSINAQPTSIGTHVKANGVINSNTIAMVEKCLFQFANRRAEFLRFVELASHQRRMCHWIVRDLWYENILVSENNQFASIVDLGAARLDWPGLDFVRLFGSLIPLANPIASPPDTLDSLWEFALRCYQESHPDHAIESLIECRLLDQLSTGLSIAQWIRWLDEGVCNLADPRQAIRVNARLTQLCRQYHSSP
jgi:hypothetical protein